MISYFFILYVENVGILILVTLKCVDKERGTEMHTLQKHYVARRLKKTQYSLHIASSLDQRLFFSIQCKNLAIYWCGNVEMCMMENFYDL